MRLVLISTAFEISLLLFIFWSQFSHLALTLVPSLINYGEMLLYFLFHLMEFSFCHSPTCIF
jgi:hypothetical protein